MDTSLVALLFCPVAAITEKISLHPVVALGVAAGVRGNHTYAVGRGLKLTESPAGSGQLLAIIRNSSWLLRLLAPKEPFSVTARDCGSCKLRVKLHAPPVR